jgi:ubiquitin-protein ligase
VLIVAPGIVAEPDADNYRYFHVSMEGPGGTPYEGMNFPFDYPDLYK